MNSTRSNFNGSGEKAVREMQLELTEMDVLLKKIEAKPYEKMARLEDQKLRLLKDQTGDSMFKLDMKFTGENEEANSPN
jgi:hypothetical protein